MLDRHPSHVPAGTGAGSERADPDRAEFTARVLVVVGIVALAAAAAAVFLTASDVFFLFFLAVLLAILLRTAADAVARWTGIGPGWSLALLVLVLAGLAAGGAVAAGSMAVSQFNQMVSELPQSLDAAKARLQQYRWGREFLQQSPSAQSLVSGGGRAGTWVSSFFSTTFGVVTNLVVLVALTLYLAATPQKYLTGLLTLVPPARRRRTDHVLGAVGFHLRWWVTGRLLAMAAVGVITGVGLAVAGVPQYLILGLVAALLTAVPYIGPVIAAVPGLLLALMQGPTTALWALGAYALAQVVENYVVTPLAQERYVHMPPVLIIAAIVLASAVFGVLGTIVATPLAVAVMVLVKTLYVEGVLGDDLKVPGEGSAATG